MMKLTTREVNILKTLLLSSRVLKDIMNEDKKGPMEKEVLSLYNKLAIFKDSIPEKVIDY